MDKRYDHTKYESEIYKKWQETNAFAPEVNPKGEPFCIIMPPPNANDPLHVGHAMFVTIEDILTRYHRMLGEAALWLPGTDHAGIETQYVFEKKLKNEGKSRFDYDRDKLYKKIKKYVEENSDVAIDQMQKLGASADWDRYKFTLNPDVVEIVINTFQKLVDDGLVYRDLRIVNYCINCGTAYSNLEIEHEDKKDKLYYIKYAFEDGDGFITVATVRPETIFGDTAVAVHPKDKRYKDSIGKKVKLPLTERVIPVIADEHVDKDFGTGALKITPAHDPNDYAIWQKHKNEIEGPLQVIEFNGKLNEHAGKFEGLRIFSAREEVVKELEAMKLLEKTTDYSHSVGTCYRCHKTIEPLPMPQFYIEVNKEGKSLTKPAIRVVEEGKIKVHGAGHDKILLHWLKNLEDWNISRQIVWGIRMPVWYSVDDNPKISIRFLDKDGVLITGEVQDLLEQFDLDQIKKGLQTLRAPVDANYKISPDSPGDNYIQETDTFDTWFSSAQWPFVTLMTGKESDFEKFYPTQVMETGYDILSFWVMRMIMMGIYKTGKVPFSQVYLHGLVRDEKGQKMSKSKGNVISPLEVVEKYGADALRMALLMSTTAGQDSSTGEGKIKGMRNFTNKIWNAARFVVMSLESENSSERYGDLNEEFNKKLADVVKRITEHLDSLRVGLAAEVVYNEFWHWYCDECIEASKEGKISQENMLLGLSTFLKLLHPYVPFVTEAIWQENKELFEEDLLITAHWPDYKNKL